MLPFLIQRYTNANFPEKKSTQHIMENMRHLSLYDMKINIRFKLVFEHKKVANITEIN